MVVEYEVLFPDPAAAQVRHLTNMGIVDDFLDTGQ
jgi:hypothetical protein